MARALRVYEIGIIKAYLYCIITNTNMFHVGRFRLFHAGRRDLRRERVFRNRTKPLLLLPLLLPCTECTHHWALYSSVTVKIIQVKWSFTYNMFFPVFICVLPQILFVSIAFLHKVYPVSYIYQ